jgi:hypothetical protein
MQLLGGRLRACRDYLLGKEGFEHVGEAANRVLDEVNLVRSQQQDA